MNNTKFAITIGRQLGSGGHLIGKALAEALGAKFYDKELLDLAAKESGFSKEIFERNDEQKGWLSSALSTHIPFLADEGWYNNQLSRESLFKFQSDAIHHAAEKESCVFVGRCADYILRDHPHCINIFISAELEDRIARTADFFQLDHHHALKAVEKGDSRRASYYNYFSDKNWGEATSYHLCVNSSVLGIAGTVELLAQFVARSVAR